MGSSPELRASDAEREQVADLLRVHAAEGRLDPDELEGRLSSAYAARTHGELAVLTADLPPAPPVARPPGRPRPAIPERLRPVVARWVAFNAIAIIVWAATGDGLDDFWPKWVLVATTVFAILRLAHTDDREMG